MAKREDEYAELKKELSADAKLGQAAEVLSKNAAWLRLRVVLEKQLAGHREIALKSAYERKGADAQKSAASAYAIESLFSLLDVVVAAGKDAREGLAEMEAEGK